MRSLAIINARLLDPASDYDGPGALVIEDGVITRVEHGPVAVAAAEIVDARGLCLAPGLIDIRVRTGEPGAEPKETLRSSATSESISTPRFIGPGCMTLAPGLAQANFSRSRPQKRKYSRVEGTSAPSIRSS